MTAPPAQVVSTIVDCVSLSFIVDNSIEWMTKLPPGFNHEIREHLSMNPPIDELTGVPIIDLDNYCCGAHGLSVLITTVKDGITRRILFDTGPEAKSISRNLQALKSPTALIETIVLSHWHRDHSGGIVEALKCIKASRQLSSMKKDEMEEERDPILGAVKVDLHPSRPIARGIAPPPSFTKVIGRLPEDPTFAEIEALGAVVDLHDEPHCVAGDTIYISGEIPRVTTFEQGLLGGVRWVQEVPDSPMQEHTGRWISEPDIMDERYAAIDVLGKGLVVVSSCSHAGICNVLRDAVNRFSRPVYMVVGGLHLAGPELQSRISPTIEFLSNLNLRPSPTYILPMHCTGFNAKVALQEAFGEGCVPAGVGMRVEVKGDKDWESRMFKPVVPKAAD